MTKSWNVQVASGAVKNGFHVREDAGTWESKHTAKTVLFYHVDGTAPNCKRFKVLADALDSFQLCDGHYCFYPAMLGAPYYFTEIKQ